MKFNKKNGFIILFTFLLLRNTNYSDDINITADYINKEVINFKNTSTQESNVYVKEKDLTITNKKIIDVSYTDIDCLDNKLSKGNGMNVEADNITIFNGGIISGSSFLTLNSRTISIGNNGNGLLTTYGDNKVTNAGVISGNAFSKRYIDTDTSDITIYNNGNGVISSGTSDITNAGIISGDASLTGNTEAYIITSFTHMTNVGNGAVGGNGTDITNTGLISGNSLFRVGMRSLSADSPTIDSGHGILSYGDNSITNSGVISGNIFSSGNSSFTNGNGIKSDQGNDITNSGVISGSISLTGNTTNTLINSLQSGNGILGNENDIRNVGTISGNTFLGEGIGSIGSTYSGNGIIGIDDVDIFNEGVISGNVSLIGNTSIHNASVYSRQNGNGVIVVEEDINKNINNNGTISGYIQTEAGIENGVKSYEDIGLSGNGIATTGYIYSSITNTGVIKGSQSAIATSDISGKVENYGVMAGKEIYSDGIELIKNETTETQKNLGIITPTDESNSGVYIKLKKDVDSANLENGKVKLDIDGDVIIESITNGTAIAPSTGETVLNTPISGNDSFKEITSDSTFDKHIINGTGIKKGVLDIAQNVTTNLTDSTVNAYKTAVIMNGNGTFTAVDSTFNGGGLENKDAIVKLSTNDYFSLTGKSALNGKLAVAGNNSTTKIGNEVMLNGDMTAKGTGNNLLLGEAGSVGNLNIYHEISGFENLKTNGNTTVFEIADITNVSNIVLESGNTLLRVNPLKRDGSDKIIGHALYGNTGTLSSTGGNLVVGLNGLSEGAVISMGGTTITQDTNDNWWKSTDHIKTNSLVLDGKLSADGKDIYITLLEALPLEPSRPFDPLNPVEQPLDKLLYENLNKIYQSVIDAKEIGELANTTSLDDKTKEEALGNLLVYLTQVYANNPYSYTIKSSRDSLKLFEDHMSYLTIKPKKNEIIVQGKGVYTGIKSDYSTHGKNYYGFDTGSLNYKTTTKTAGGIASIEYGLTDKTSAGVVIGGNNQDINFKGPSKIKGNSLYVGTFAKTDVNNFKFMGGIGYQYTRNDVDRVAFNKYDSFKTSAKYDVNSFNVFLEGKYVYKAEDNWSVEPKVRLSYYHVEQDGVNEGYSSDNISIKTDKIKNNTVDVEVGVDLVKTSYLEKGRVKNIVSLSAINTVGDKEKELKGYVIGKEKTGKQFNIKGTELPDLSGKVSYNIEYEKNNGMIYTGGASIEFSKDYNRNISATIGIGYRF